MNKSEVYLAAKRNILAVLEGENNRLAKMATVSCLLSEAFADSYFWTGFYIVDEQKGDELVVGPYQGSLGCLRIKFGRGVCGAAALSRETQIVEDVHAIKDHIACDSRSKSEIVVPVFDESDKLIAVFDVDSTAVGTFDSADKEHLEDILSSVFV